MKTRGFFDTTRNVQTINMSTKQRKMSVCTVTCVNKDSIDFGSIKGGNSLYKHPLLAYSNFYQLRWVNRGYKTDKIVTYTHVLHKYSSTESTPLT